MKIPLLAVLSSVLTAACYRVIRTPPPVAWEAAPLAPRLQFIESIAPGDVARSEWVDRAAMAGTVLAHAV